MKLLITVTAPLLTLKVFDHQVEQRGGKSKHFEEDLKSIIRPILNPDHLPRQTHHGSHS
jgi:hypothetical protein